MMMMGPGKKKKMVSTIIAQISKPKGAPMHESSSEGEQDEMSMGLESAAKGMIDAMESKDPQALIMHLQDFMYLCKDEGEPEEMKE